MSDNNTIKVSVLVPVYGVEKYIERCARSLFNQTMTDEIEFIFVDDCTPDRSIEILKNVLNDYPHRKYQTRILHHEVNKGLPEARNTGVNNACGEYVIHCDSDDWVEPNMYELLYSQAKLTDADIVGCDFFEELPDKQVYRRQNFNLDSLQACKNLLTLNQMFFNIWSRLVKKTLYKDNDITFDPEVRMGEDALSSIKLHLSANKISGVSNTLYHYNCTNDSSMTKNWTYKDVESIEKLINAVFKFLHTTSAYDKLKVQFYEFVFNQKFRIYFKSNLVTRRWLYDFYPIANKYIWKYRMTTRVKIVYSFIPLGLPFISKKIFKIYRHCLS
ncbi:MAG: glycosyltransferase family 2 protein [Duncaniella sp.]|nr:glycosyltransferase family 2 protein [Muribaculum sp.]MCM1254620.1 glycosyltransferase family 2 protein [Duncaniella sp.]